MPDYTKRPRGTRKRFTWSYTRFSTYKSCPMKYNMNIHRKEFGFPAPVYGRAAERGVEIHKKAEEFVKGNIKGMPKELSKFNVEFNALKKQNAITEEDWWFDRDWNRIPHLDWNNVWLMVKADAHVLIDDILVLVDYKTGRFYPSHSKQAELYGVAGACIYDTVEAVEAEFWYLDHARNEIFEFEMDNLYSLKDMWSTVAHEMETRKSFEPTPSEEACKWCDFHYQKGGPCDAGI